MGCGSSHLDTTNRKKDFQHDGSTLAALAVATNYGTNWDRRGYITLGIHVITLVIQFYLVLTWYWIDEHSKSHAGAEQGTLDVENVGSFWMGATAGMIIVGQIMVDTMGIILLTLESKSPKLWFVGYASYIF